MLGSRSASQTPHDPTIEDDRPTHADLKRPVYPGPTGERVGALLARVPISPARLLVICGGGALALVAAVWLLRPPPPPVESTLPRARTTDGHTSAAGTPTSPVSTRSPALVVDAAGSVRRPGLYRLAPGARVNDLVRIAGGLRSGADPGRLNLAAPLADGQRLYVPKIGELTTPVPVGPTGGPDGGAASTATSQAASPDRDGGVAAGPAVPIDLNTATADQLDTLPGVGPSTAASIIDYRTQHGPFHSVDELLDVRGIGDAKLAALRAKVRV